MNIILELYKPRQN